MDGKLVRELHEKAQLAGKYIGAHRLGGGWEGYNDDEALWHKIIGAGEIEFHRNAGAACIVFKDIRPKKVLHSKYEKPMLSNTVIEDINASVIVNQSSEEVERTYTYSEEETNSSSQEAGVEVGIGIRQLIGYGGAVSPVSGETEITVNVNAHYAKTWGSENSVSKEVSNTVKVPANSQVTISTQKSTSDFSQKMEHEIELDYNMAIKSWTNASVEKAYDIEVENMGEMKDIVEGYGKHSNPLSQPFLRNPVSEYPKKHLPKPATVKIAQTLEFSNASTGKVIVTEEKL